MSLCIFLFCVVKRRFDVFNLYVCFTGGYPGDIGNLTGNVYRRGFQGCLRNLRGSKSPGPWSSVNIQVAATGGAGIGKCDSP